MAVAGVWARVGQGGGRRVVVVWVLQQRSSIDASINASGVRRTHTQVGALVLVSTQTKYNLTVSKGHTLHDLLLYTAWSPAARVQVDSSQHPPEQCLCCPWPEGPVDTSQHGAAAAAALPAPRCRCLQARHGAALPPCSSSSSG